MIIHHVHCPVCNRTLLHGTQPPADLRSGSAARELRQNCKGRACPNLMTHIERDEELDALDKIRLGLVPHEEAVQILRKPPQEIA